MPTHVTPLRVNYNVPLDVEVEAVFHILMLNKVGRHTCLRAENFKKWLQEAYPAEGTYTPPKPEQWQNMVGLTQYM